jgi:hypothetical protein
MTLNERTTSISRVFPQTARGLPPPTLSDAARTGGAADTVNDGQRTPKVGGAGQDETLSQIAQAADEKTIHRCLPMRLSQEVKDAIEKIAYDERRSVASLVEKILADYAKAKGYLKIKLPAGYLLAKLG